MEQPTCRGASLLAGYRHEDLETVSQWSVRERDRALFDLRGELFGNDALALATCPGCDEPLEVPLDLTSLRPGSDHDPEPFEHDGWRARLRSPTTQDLTALLATHDEDAALELLLKRCVTSLYRPDAASATLEQAPPAVRDLLRLHLADALDDVDIELTLECTGCGQPFTAPFDIAPFLLREIEAWAGRIQHEVHVIAVAYGWDEATILALSPRRLQAYLRLIGGVA